MAPILVVLDDDPTGTQTVHGVPVLTSWSIEDLATELTRSSTFFLLTNSRGLTEAQAVELASEIGLNLSEAVELTGVSIEVVSRSDSTLRGHYPAEVDAMAAALGWPEASTTVIPFFGPGGRVTKSDIHYVDNGGELVPVGRTEFADDATFGFTSSNLRSWVQEKTNGRISASAVTSLSLDTLRNESSSAIAARLVEAGPRATVVVNATADSDLVAFSAALDLALPALPHWIHRTAASFVAIRAKLEPRPLLTGRELSAVASSTEDTSSGGLVVVGSHVKKTTAQLEHALKLPGVVGVELSVDELTSGNARLDELTSFVVNEMGRGSDVVLFTSRDVRTAANPEDSLALSRRVSGALCAVVAGLNRRPRFLIAKGGITSSDIATESLHVKRAMVLGQIQPGVAVWQTGPESRFPGLAYVVYPGNVGAETGLAEAIVTCRGQ